MKKKIIALALSLLMLLPLALMGCNDEEEPPAPTPPPPPPTENVLDSIEFLDTKTGPSTIKNIDIPEGTMYMPLNDSLIATAKPTFDTEDPTKLISTEYKLLNVYNDTAVSIVANNAITPDAEGYASAITAVEVEPYDNYGDFVIATISYGDGAKVDFRLYNKYGAMVAETKGVAYDSYLGHIDFDEDFNDYSYMRDYGVGYYSFLKKIYTVKRDDLTLTEVIDFNKVSFDLDSVVYVKDLNKYISYVDNGRLTTKVVIFNNNFVPESANEFIGDTNAIATYCKFISATSAIYTELIVLPEDAEEFDAFSSTYKLDIKITKFDFATGEGTDMPLGNIVLIDSDYYYTALEYEMMEVYGMKLKSTVISSEYYTIEDKRLVAHNNMVAVDENLNVLKYIEYAFPSDEDSMAFKLPNGELIMMTSYAMYHVNADGTLGDIVSLEDVEYNNVWKIHDEKEVYDSNNALIYTIPETRELVAILNNSLILSEEVKNATGTVIGFKYFLWKGVGNETKLGDDPFDYNVDPSNYPTEGTLSMLAEDVLSSGYYAIMTGNWADLVAGKDIYTLTIYDDLGNKLAEYANVTDHDIMSRGNSLLELEITTYDAENNPTVATKLVVIINQEKANLPWF